MKTTILSALLLFSLPGLAVAGAGDASSELDTEKKRFSYAMGVVISQNILPQKDTLDMNAFLRALDDVLRKGGPMLLSEEEIQKILLARQEKSLEAAGDNRAKGIAFLEENGKKDGMVTTASGLQYTVLKTGKGAKPSKDDKVEVHYRGTLIDGTEFDSSYSRGEPATFGVSQVIQGWQEALQLMPQGSKWRVFVPSDLAYGERGAGNLIGPHATLVFEVELLNIQ